MVFHEMAGQNLESAIRLSFKFQWLVAFEVTDKLLWVDDREDLYFPVYFGEL